MTGSGPEPAEWACLRREEPDLFHSLVKMHLSILLDLATDDCDCSHIHGHAHSVGGSTPGGKEGGVFKRRIFTPKKRSSHASHVGVMEGAALTLEGVCQVYQLIAFLQRDAHLRVEGVFRKHGNLKKQQLLKDRLNRGVSMDLDDGTFSVHECAAVLKSFLAELAEPLLTDAHYQAHCQVAQMGRSAGPDGQEEVRAKRIQCLQLLFLLIPEANYSLLKDLLPLLHKVHNHSPKNLMPAQNLGTMFAPLILCPRKLSAESMQSNHQLLSEAVAFMIEAGPRILFELPVKLQEDIKSHIRQRPHRQVTPKKHYSSDDKPQSPVVNTIFTFVDRERTHRLAHEFSSESAIAELYAHIQSMPESAQKKRLVNKLNDANGHGTPGIIRSGANRLKSGGEGIRNLLTPRRSNKVPEPKIGRNGSYSFKTPNQPRQILHSSFRRQIPEDHTNQKLLSPQSSPAILVSPETIDSIVKKNEDNLDGSYVAPSTPLRTFRSAPPPVPERVSSLESTEDSPITTCTQKMSLEMKESMMTPRSRKPVLSVSTVILEPEDSEFKVPPSKSDLDGPCQPQKYNEDEPDLVHGSPAKHGPSSSDSDSDDYFASLESDEESPNKSVGESIRSEKSILAAEKEDKSKVYTSRSLRQEFHRYLEENDIIQTPPQETASNPANDSSVSVTSSVISQEARLLLNGELSLSDSMQAVLDGDNPSDLDKSQTDEEVGEDDEIVVVNPSVLVPISVDSSYSDKENDSSYNSAHSSSDVSSYSSASTLPYTSLPTDIPLPTFENRRKEIAVQHLEVTGSNNRKRRSLTETGDLNPIARRKTIPGKRNIYFETDL
ncbi:uncharacterized protein LOC131879177 [Tigriopus californicus]|uniref:uncharacterized protein LOC131879177 n=1 Tax=Tigriopus californicus TaxID=6832 RepID=UPI0027DA971A|nr:uncharacterized protein LOC131879177 [Tigriopus californicus]